MVKFLQIPISLSAILLFSSSLLAGEAQVWTLSRALQHVREQNPDARQAAFRIEEAEAKLMEAKSALWPKITAESAYSITDNPPSAFMSLLNQRQLPTTFDFNNPDTTDNLNTHLRIEYPLFTGGARKAGIGAAESGVNVARENAEAVVDSLQLTVTRSWFQIFRTDRLVDAANARLRNHEASLERAEKLLDANTVLESDVLNLETQVLSAETDVVIARNLRDIQVEHLRNLLGLENEDSFTLATSFPSVTQPDSSGRQIRPEEKAKEARIDAAEHAVDKAKAARKPKVSAFGLVQHDEGFTEPDGANSWMAGIAVQLDLWEGHAKKARIAAAEAQRAQAKEELRKTRLAIELEIRKARLGLEAAQKRVELSRKAIESAEASVDITRKRFEQGLVLSTQLIDVETALTNARVRLAEAEAAQRIAIAELRYALGLPILPEPKP